MINIGRVLKSNTLNGTLEIGASYSSHLRRIDLESNLITEFKGNVEAVVEIM